MNENVYRGGAVRHYGNLETRWVYTCKDGTLSALALGGTVSAGSMRALVAWMDEEGYASKEMVERDWAAQDLQALIMAGPDDPEVVDFLDVQRRVQKFFDGKTKKDLFDRAIADSIMLAPCQTVQDIRESPQLAAREYWRAMEPAAGRDALDFPGPYIKLSETPIQIARRAPSVGEHDDEILGASNPPAPAVRPKANGSTALPFEGLRVLDMSWVGVGPITMKYLADHGAEVIRVESVSRPDPARSVPPYKDGKPGFNRSQFPANFNTGKYGLGLNMSKPEARELIKRIITTWRPDVLAESFTPRAMRGWGLDYPNVRKLKDDIIYYSTCQQGQTGPHASYGGYGNLAAALAGFYHVTGWPDLEPAGVYGAYTDFVNPPNGVAAVIAALDHRRRTGQGQHLDLSQYECAVHYLAPQLLDYQLTGRVAGPRRQPRSPVRAAQRLRLRDRAQGPTEPIRRVVVRRRGDQRRGVGRSAARHGVADVGRRPALRLHGGAQGARGGPRPRDRGMDGNPRPVRGHAPPSGGGRAGGRGAEGVRPLGRPAAQGAGLLHLARTQRVRPHALRPRPVQPVADAGTIGVGGADRRAAQRAGAARDGRPDRGRGRRAYCG